MTVGVVGLDIDRLTRHLDVAAPGLVTGPLTAELIPGGKSNLSYVVSDGASLWVLRRPPLGHVLATAHDMSREHRVITALAQTAVPVPRTVLLCEEPDVLGAPFFLMEYVDGTVYRSAEQTRALTAHQCHAIAGDLVDVLAALHDIDPAAAGLGDFGRPAGFLDRQLRRWKAQLDASRSRTVPGIDELHARLTADVPTSAAAAIVHGDFRLDNVLVGEDDRVAAVLDWEMATLGDPLADLGLLLVYWDGLAAIPDNAVSTAVIAGTAFPPGHDLVERYAACRDVDLSRLDWYAALGCFKLAVIAEGIHYRHAAGQTVGAGFDTIGGVVRPLVELGLSTLTDGLAKER